MSTIHPIFFDAGLQMNLAQADVLSSLQADAPFLPYELQILKDAYLDIYPDKKFLFDKRLKSLGAGGKADVRLSRKFRKTVSRWIAKVPPSK